MAPTQRASLSAIGFLSALALLVPLLLALTALFPNPAAAAAADPTPTVLDTSDKYAYQGCYNETTAVEGAGGVRALAGGINEVRKGDMTVQLCLGFCGNGETKYKYAGLEYSRECWCAQRLSGASAKMPDSDCNLGCDGDLQTACGGSLKLSVYMLNAAPSVQATYGLVAITMVTGSALFSLL